MVTESQACGNIVIMKIEEYKTELADSLYFGPWNECNPEKAVTLIRMAELELPDLELAELYCCYACCCFDNSVKYGEQSKAYYEKAVSIFERLIALLDRQETDAVFQNIDKKVEKNSEINNKIDFRTNNKNNDNSVSKKENNDLLKNKILKLVKIFILSLILLILLFYLIASIYKFIKLSNLISKLDKYKNLDNYYCHYINYSNGECILDEEIWYYNNIYKIKCNFDRNNKDNVSLTKYINLNENQISSYDINGNLLSEYNILDEKFYKNGSYMYYLFLKDEKNSEKILKSAFNIGKLEIINNSDKEKIQIKYLNVEAMLDNEYFPEMIIYEKNKTKFIGFYYLKVNCVKEEDINII